MPSGERTRSTGERRVVGLRAALFRQRDQIAVVKLTLSLRLSGDPGHERSSSRPRKAREMVVAHTSPGAY